MREVFCYFFSPTGTGRALAETLPIERRVNLTTPGDRAVAPLLPPDCLFILIFPVYAHRVPAPLVRWLRAMPPWTGSVCLMAVYGSAGPGGALAQAARLLRKKGMTVVGAAQLPGPHCYDVVPQVPHAVRNWDGVEEFYARVSARAAGCSAPAHLPGGFDPAALLPQGLLARLTAPVPRPQLDTCSGCGVCERSCPTGAIPGSPGRCVRCAACVRACPTGARRLRFFCQAPVQYIKKHMEVKQEPRFYL